MSDTERLENERRITYEVRNPLTIRQLIARLEEAEARMGSGGAVFFEVQGNAVVRLLATREPDATGISRSGIYLDIDLEPHRRILCDEEEDRGR